MKITPLMTSLHEGHMPEERIGCIDNMLTGCKDTKFTVLQAFWWYRRYTMKKLDKLEKIEQIIDEVKKAHYEYDGTMVVNHSLAYSRIEKILESEE